MVASSKAGTPRQQGDRRSSRGPAFTPVESKLGPPWTRPGIVPRTALVERLLATPAAPVICVVAPAGYGKTTLLAQWANCRDDRVGWVTIDRRDNDPMDLVTYLAVALAASSPSTRPSSSSWPHQGPRSRGRLCPA